ncbi:MAG: 50S ribosomal protein L29 [Planctomycetes bacterium]|nr:50S ribosomal protein L29 [Planctomycetota bacterium]
MNAHDIRKLTLEQVKDELTASRRKIFDLRAQAVTEKVANTSQFGTLRRTIARLLTEQGVRARAASPAAGKKFIRGLSKEGREKLIAKTVHPSTYSKAGTKNPAGKTAEKSAKKTAGATAAVSKPKTRRKAEVKS